MASAQTDLEQLEKDIKQNKIMENLTDNAVAISLHDVIGDGLRKNTSEKARQYQIQLNEIILKDAHDDFYFPKLNLTMATTSDHFTENFYRDNKDNASSAKTPTGAVGLEIEDYTLFNWGKDYLDYLNSKETYKRTKENFVENKRELRLEIIQTYFNLARQNKTVRIYKKHLSHTSFIYRLAKEKMSLKKVSSQEFLEAKALFLKAHQDFHSALYNYYEIQESMSTTLSDNLKTIYKPVNSLKYKPIAFSSNESFRFVNKNNRNILDAKTNVNNTNRNYQKVLKNNLPLPKFSVKLGSYQRAFSSDGYDDQYETFAGSKNVEIAATMNMSWRIYGSGGFFNSRTTETSFYNKKLSELSLREAHRQAEVSNRLTHSKIIYLERKYEANKANLKNARRVFDKTVDNYLESKTDFTSVKRALERVRDTGIEHEITKYEHLTQKITLAKLMGVDDFPGEKFDELVEK